QRARPRESIADGCFRQLPTLAFAAAGRGAVPLGERESYLSSWARRLIDDRTPAVRARPRPRGSRTPSGRALCRIWGSGDRPAHPVGTPIQDARACWPPRLPRRPSLARDRGPRTAMRLWLEPV